MTLDEQVQQVRRRLVMTQVRQLKLLPFWNTMDEDFVAECVLAAGGDGVVANRLATRWLAELNNSRTPDITWDECDALVRYIGEQVADGFKCDCGTCGPVERIQPVNELQHEDAP